MDGAYELNRTRLDHLTWALRAASVFLVLEVGAWVVNIATVTSPVGMAGKPTTPPAPPKPKPIGPSPLWPETHGNQPPSPRPRPSS